VEDPFIVSNAPRSGALPLNGMPIVVPASIRSDSGFRRVKVISGKLTSVFLALAKCVISRLSKSAS
jgi:hypothetical protein